MESIIREKRRITIGRKRITADAIRQMANIVKAEIDQEQSNLNLLTQFSLDAADNSSYESQSIIIYDANGLLEKKPIQKINMKFATNQFTKNIEVQIIHSAKENSDSYIMVSGDDTNWVNGVIARFNEVIGFAESQPSYKWLTLLCSIFIPVAFGIGYFRLILRWRDTHNDIFGFLFIGELIGGLFMFVNILYQDEKLWPAIELQTGPTYLLEARKRRITLFYIFGGLVLPLIVNFIYDFFK